MDEVDGDPNEKNSFEGDNYEAAKEALKACSASALNAA
jgi:hypothetical protein